MSIRPIIRQLIARYPHAVILIGFACPALTFANCPPGQVKNALTEGRCCWGGQTWSKKENRCVGLAECPSGLRPSADGEYCVDVKEACDDGQRRMGEGCCWPGQTWRADEKQCVGRAECPTGFVDIRGGCAKLPPRGPGKRRPYVTPNSESFVMVKPGAFTQGSDRREIGRYRNERPFTVALSRFLLVKKTEVTQEEWLQLVGHNPSYFKHCGLSCPVERVNWYEVLSWLNALSLKEGLSPCYRLSECRGEMGGGCRSPDDEQHACAGDFVCKDVQFAGPNCAGFRLPTESEWEYFARAGTVEMTYAGRLTGRLIADAKQLDAIAWHRGNSQVQGRGGLACESIAPEQSPPGPPLLCGTHPVAQKEANPWEIHDVLGNVAEWVWDGFGNYPVRSKLNPIRDVGIERGVRGGSWRDGPLGLRVAQRGRLSPRGRNAGIGFRYVRTVAPDTVERKPDRPKGVQTPKKTPPMVPRSTGSDALKSERNVAPTVPAGQPIQVNP